MRHIGSPNIKRSSGLTWAWCSRIICITSYHFVSLRITSYHFVSLRITSYHFVSLRITSYHFVSLRITSYHFVSLRITSYHFVSLRITSYHFVSLRITSYHFVSLRITSYHFVSLRITSYHFVSLRITSYPPALGEVIGTFRFYQISTSPKPRVQQLTLPDSTGSPLSWFAPCSRGYLMPWTKMEPRNNSHI